MKDRLERTPADKADDSSVTTTKSPLTYSVDRWNTKGNVTEHVAEIDDLTVATATYKAACERWPDEFPDSKEGLSRNRGQPTNTARLTWARPGGGRKSLLRTRSIDLSC